MAHANTITKLTTIAALALTVTRGVSAGWMAAIPQVLVAQAMGRLLGIRERADIGPRFVRRAVEHAGHPLSPLMQWVLGGVFHVEYAAGWGIPYAFAIEPLGARRVPPLLSGALLGGIVYTTAFSPFGAATRTGAEREPHRCSAGETALHCTAALSFALTTAYSYRWLRARW